jgi:hypothetical protein
MNQCIEENCPVAPRKHQNLMLGTALAPLIRPHRYPAPIHRALPHTSLL